MRDVLTYEHTEWCNGGRRAKRSFRRAKSAQTQCIRRSKRIQNIYIYIYFFFFAHIVCGRPTLKYVERFRNGLVCEPYEISLYERTFMSEPFIEKHAISTELSNVNREKHRRKSHRVCRRDREPSRIPIRSLKRLRNKSRKVRKICLCTYSPMNPHVIYIILLC